jgi:SAM-dependent methyltransferase
MDAPLPALTGVPLRSYDLIAMLDVLEHIDEDRAALAALAERLRPGGRILLTVPAHPWMWSAHDEVNHHKRRYTRRTLKSAVEGAGLRVEMLSWFNSLLFPLAAAARLAGRVTGKDDSDDKLPPAPVNRLFEAVFGLERYAIGRVPFPPGVSIAAIVSAS